MKYFVLWFILTFFIWVFFYEAFRLDRASSNSN